jgi:hypothetical protein
MIRINWRKWNRVIHRDFGYFFFGMTFIYGLSGIALNHIKDWNPNYVINVIEFHVDVPSGILTMNDAQIASLLNGIGEASNYKKHYFPDGNTIKIFLNGGSVTIHLSDGSGVLEKIRRRPLLNQVNFLHYNPGKWWKYYSDIYAAALILLGFTGLFIIKGKNGITNRGAWMTLLGIIIPLIFLFLYS